MSMNHASLSCQRVTHLLQGVRRTRLLIIGDLMLDEFVWGTVTRISPEAPVPVVRVESESLMPGGAANVASNIRALGGRVDLAGIIGGDRWGNLLLDALAARQIGTTGILRDRSRPTTVKTRVIAHHQQVVRVDREEAIPPTPAVISRLTGVVRRMLKKVDGVIIEDYGKGVVTRQLLEEIIPLVRSHRKIITVDPKQEHLDLYQGVSAITPNRAEAGEMVGRTLETEEAVMQAGETLLRTLRCDAVLITLGEDGMRLFQRNGRCVAIPTVAQEVFDVAGAGDTVIGAFTLGLASGASMRDAAILANHAAGVVVGKVGVATATPQELVARVNHRGRVPVPRRSTPGPRRVAQAARSPRARRSVRKAMASR